MKRTVYVDVVEPGKGLVTLGNGEGGTVIRQGPGNRYRVEDDLGILIGSATSFREGALRVAEHYGVTVDGVEVEQEWREYKRG